MNLNFMTYFPAEKFPPTGKETNFVPKILACVDERIRASYTPKLHTMRRSNRWRKGMTLHMKTGARFNPRQFNREIQGLQICQNVQKIRIKWKQPEDACPIITIDGHIYKKAKHFELARNDGFDSLRDFYCYFNEDFEGQIIHWTQLVY